MTQYSYVSEGVLGIYDRPYEIETIFNESKFSSIVAIDEPGGNHNLNINTNGQQNKRIKAMSTNLEYEIS